MSDKKKGKQRGIEENKVTKEEYAVAKYLRFGLPAREGKLHGMEVKCFIANAAIDKLLESKWSSNKNKTDPIFTNRASCIFYMNVLLEKGLFHRADRDKKKKDKESTKKKKKEKDAEKEEPSGEEELKQRKGKKEKKSKKEKEEQAITEKNKDDTENKSEKKKEEKKKKEKRLKLLMSDDQWFEDGDEVYVWIYDPVNVKNFLIGLLMVLGAIGLCMFPLWPEEVRIGVYYLSLAAAGFVGFILFLAVVRLILFCCVWALTMGRHHFWFLPNLTEDVGFFDSFRPLYKHDLVSKEDDSDNRKKKKKTKSDKDNKEQDDKKESKKQIEKSSDKDDSDEFEVIKKEDLDENKEDQEENIEHSAEDDEEENDLNEEESDDNEEEDTQNNSGSEMEDKKSK